MREKEKPPMDNHDCMNKNTTTEQFDKQSLIEHLRDLRSCLIVSLIATSIGFAAAYTYIERIGIWFFKPLTDVLPKGTSLIFTSYQEGFFFI
jgi:Sec-independent protein secretion pathway component TatC